MEKNRYTTNDFSRKHQALEDSIYAILASIRSYTLVRLKLSQLKEQLAAYFRYQDDEFYKVLGNRYGEDKQALKMLEFLICDQRYVKTKFVKFFDKYGGHLSEAAWRNFPREFTEFSRELMARFQMEKEYLFPLLDQF